MNKTIEPNGSLAKKKAPPKPRKRKISDVGAVSKAGMSSAKRLSTDSAAEINPYEFAAEAHAGQTAQLKPFARGELVESSKFNLQNAAARVQF